MTPSVREIAAEIRPAGPGDQQGLLDAIDESRPELRPFMEQLSRVTMESTVQWLSTRESARAAKEEYDFVVCEPHGGTLLGGCGINHVSEQPRFANVYYWVRSTQAGQGIGTLAVRQLADFGFKELGLWRLELVIDAENAASLRLAEKLGAKREGTLRNRLCANGSPRTAIMYSLVPDDL